MKIMGMDASAVFVLVLLLLIAVVPARIAKKKGYSYAGFYVFGIFVWPAALIVALCIKDRTNEAAAEGANALKAYKELLDSGAITQEEFDAKKAEILGSDKA
jgi:uncharacterized membrane protein